MRCGFAVGVVVAATAALMLAGSVSAITSVTCGSTIKSPGSYKLKSDCTGRGITIKASNVTLDLNRHTMTAGAAEPHPSYGIQGRALRNVRILGPGVIKNFFLGIFFAEAGPFYVGNVTLRKNTGAGAIVDGAEGGTFEGTLAENNAAHGIEVTGGVGVRLHNVRATGNGSGITVGNSEGTRITGSTASGNGIGIYVLDTSIQTLVQNNTALGNSFLDLSDGASCAYNTWTGNTFGTSSDGCIS